MCHNDFKLCEKNVFENTGTLRVKYEATVRSDIRIASLYVYTNSVCHLPTHTLFSKGASLEFHLFVFSYIVYNFIRWTDTRAHRTLSTHSRSSSLFIVKTNSDERADSFFFSSSPQTVCSLLCVFMPIWTVTAVDARGPEKSANLYSRRRRTHDNTTYGRCQARYMVAKHTTADVYVIL